MVFILVILCTKFVRNLDEIRYLKEEERFSFYVKF